MILLIVSQFSLINGGKLEENNRFCMQAFQKIAGSVPSDIFSTGMEFQTLNQFRLKDRDAFIEHLTRKAALNLFVPVVQTDDRLVFVKPDEKMRVVVGGLAIYRFTHYLYAYFPDKSHACLYEFIPSMEGE